MNKYRKLLSDTVILGFGTFASKVLVLLLLVPLYTNYLKPEQYSVADLISQTANLLIPLACAGICDGLFRFTLDANVDKPSVFKTGITVLLMASAVFLAASPLLMLVNYFSEYAWLIIAYVLAANLHSACAQYVRANDRPKLFALQGIINTALVIGFNLLFLIVLDMGVTGYVLAVVVSDLIVSVFLIIAARLYRDFVSGRFSFKLMKQLIGYSAPMIPTTIFWWITNVSDHYILTWLCGEAVNGLYVSAYKIPTLLTLLCTVFYEAWQFSAVKDAEQKTKSKFFGRVFSYYSSLMFAAGAGVVLLCRVFVDILFADAYSGAWKYIPVLTAAAVFSALTTFMGSVYLVKKKSVLSFLTSMLGALINLGLNFLLIPYFGAQGAAVATAVCYIIVFAVRTASAQKYVKFWINYLRLTVNTVLLAAECVIVIIGMKLWWVYAGAVAALLLAVNARTLTRCVLGALKQFMGGRKSAGS